jgi:DNA-binding response OmpR family regulator
VRGRWVVSRYFREEVRGRWWTAGSPPATWPRIDADGFMQITDRSKDVIKSGGEWIGSIDLENIAMAHPAVAMAACIACQAPEVGRAAAAGGGAQTRRGAQPRGAAGLLRGQDCQVVDPGRRGLRRRAFRWVPRARCSSTSCATTNCLQHDRVAGLDHAHGRMPGLASRLRDAGHAVDQAEFHALGIDRSTLTGIDLITVDLARSTSNPASIIATLRRLDSQIPILAINARDVGADRIKALDAGADDCVSESQSEEELLARIRVWHRRGMGSADPVITVGPLVFDTHDRTVHLARRRLQLSRRELGLLEALIRRSGRHVSAGVLIDQMFEWDEALTPNSIQVYMCRLRRKLDHPGILIQTVRGLGYVLRTTAAS